MTPFSGTQSSPSFELVDHDLVLLEYVRLTCFFSTSGEVENLALHVLSTIRVSPYRMLPQSVSTLRSESVIKESAHKQKITIDYDQLNTSVVPM